jgi:hypothetical protein
LLIFLQAELASRRGFYKSSALVCSVVKLVSRILSPPSVMCQSLKKVQDTMTSSATRAKMNQDARDMKKRASQTTTKGLAEVQADNHKIIVKETQQQQVLNFV